ncbi:MAG TPA: hypothetical protein ENK52_07055 [Saprospiraceae bacterium]|nr:hypothetical protein [Saprospiraceae bacterium]
MSAFDQRDQNVINQHNFNVSGNVNFGTIYDRAAFIEELKKLQTELNITILQNSIKDEVALVADLEIQKAILQAEKKTPDKHSLLNHITKAKNLVAGVAGLADALGQAYEKIKLLF